MSELLKLFPSLEELVDFVLQPQPGGREFQQ